MFLNIITPCSRPQNLIEISKSINIPKENYRWIVVFDSEEIPLIEVPDNCEIYCHKNPLSTVGHAQRNFALNLIKNGHIYFNDDDTIIFPKLWDEIRNLDNDFISFQQIHKEGNLRLEGDIIEVGHIDSHNFIISKKILGESRFIIDRYDADGYFAKECFTKSKSPIHLKKILSTYNFLR